MPVPADIYEEDVDFTALALQYPDFSKRLKPNGQLDFSDPESVRQLTKALLHRDFNLTIDLPDNRLCPPVPNRFNYVNFVQKLVDSTRFDYGDGNDATSKVLVLDIGTGASAIYPLLICRQRSNWFCLVTEIDPKSSQYASKNIKTNSLESNIRLIPTDQSGQTILPSSQYEQFDNFAIKIMLTNPPFYSSESELLTSAKQKSRPPNSACTGAPIEMITPGGEVQFVTRIIHESKLPRNRHKIQWFSSMLGKYSSLTPLITLLKSLDCSNYAVTEFIQGQKTRRWCIAWSWISFRPPTHLARGIPSLEKKLLPFPSEYTYESTITDLSILIQKLDMELSRLDLSWRPNSSPLPTPISSSSTSTAISPNSTDTETSTIILLLLLGIGISPKGDVWSRRARRKATPNNTTNQHVSASQSNSSPPIDEEMKDVDADIGANSPSSTSSQFPPSPSLSQSLSSQEPALVFKIYVSHFTPPPPLSSSPQESTSTSPRTTTTQVQQPNINANANSNSKSKIKIQYIQGQNTIIFESFCGWMKRKFT